ncbi:hypothetical protein SAMN02745900_01005 [Pseudomonas sp. URIL14HWK12:I8]|uniref:hypothetical protein n=1 Tax=unclassified Pseudomonas TaxID=196821 RepID=UPI00040FD1B0|nr:MULTISPECIES: hypothetical protein [unclassified Pseudomonas]SNB62841.1 hypothetical protein SAMN02745900_01005 [Pseudomonas sp. URIL14HWK12:I8]
MASTNPHETIKIQAKRLRDLFGIDLTTAKYVLARGPYGCANWADLRKRVDVVTPLENALQLAELPHSPIAAAYLAKHLRRLASSVSQLILTNCNLPELCERLRQVFAVPGKPIGLADVLQTITPTRWLPADIGPDPLAVIQSRACINGVEVLLLGTRIFWPRLFTFDAEITVDARTAEPFGEKLKVMWELDPWHRASRNYLLEYQRGDDWDDLPDFIKPQIAECPRMQQHREWLNNCLLSWREEPRYNDDGEEFIPVLYQGNAYLVFGIPCPGSVVQPPSRRQYVQFSGKGSNRSQVILLGGQLLNIEMLAAPNPKGQQDWGHEDYHRRLCNDLLGGAATAGWTSPPSGGWGDLLFLTPASHFTLTCELRVEIQPEPDETLCTLQTDNPELAVEVLERAHRGQYTCYENTLSEASYGMRIQLAEEIASVNLSLSLNFIEETVWQSAHLIGRRVTHKDEHGQTLYLEIKPALLKLVQRQPLKVLKKAICERQILRVHGLPEQLQETRVLLPDPLASDSSDIDESNPLTEPFFDGEGELLFGFISYQRDNF